MIPPIKPSVLIPYQTQLLLREIKGFPKYIEKWFYSPTLPKVLYQGDLMHDLPVVLIDEGGEPTGRYCDVMLLSTTCDINQPSTEFITIAPMISFTDYSSKKIPGKWKKRQWKDHLDAVKKNIISGIFHIPGRPQLPPFIVDFSLACPISRRLVSDAFVKTPEQRFANLSMTGYYLFLTKLSYHFARPEPDDVTRQDIIK